MKIEVQLNHYDIRIMIDGLPHVVINRSEYIGYQSYFSDESKLTIEFFTKTNCIKAEYDNRDKWVAVLKELNNKL